MFTGKEVDGKTGLVYFGARYYDADTGRFISQDSYLGESEAPPSLHRYLYGYSNPTVYIDLEGHAAWDVVNNLINGGKEAWKGTTKAVSAARKALPGISLAADKSVESIAKQLTPDSTTGRAVAAVGVFVVNNAMSGLTAAASVEEALERPGVKTIGFAVLAVAPGVPKGTGKVTKKFAKEAEEVGEKLLTKEARSGVNLVEKEAVDAGKAGVQVNKAAGDAFERQVMEQLQQTQTGVVSQVTVKTQSGVKTRIDLMGRDTSGNVVCTECKASATAPLTKNQSVGFPEIKESGAVVVGKGKPGFPGGTEIPPTEVDIVRP